MKVAVAGASGYAGGELLRLLLGHPEVQIGALTAGANAGRRFGDLVGNLPALTDRTIEETSPEVLAGHDVVFLALPHGASAELAATLDDETVVIDCGADHRLRSAEHWARWYGGAHSGSWPYGLPELITADGKARETLHGASRIAVPGCYPTVSSLTMAPAVAAGLVEPAVTVVAVSGTSGAGKSLKPHLLGAEVMGSASAYGVGGKHRHTPELVQNLSEAAGGPVTASFTPVLAPMPRGILATATARLARDASEADIREVYTRAYGAEPFVSVLPEGQWPATKNTVGANLVQLQLTIDTDANSLVVVGAEDNLTKGTAGAAVQCMNLALGLDETLGLPTTGVAP